MATQAATSTPTSDSPATMTMGDLQRITGLSPASIRLYQRRGVLPGRTNRETDGGWQRFDEDFLARVAITELAKSSGFSLEELARFMDALDTDPDSVPESAPIWHGLAEAKMADIDNSLERLDMMRRMLQDALAYSYVAPDRADQVAADLGWVEGGTDEEMPPVDGVAIPASTEALKNLGSAAEQG